MDVNETDQQGKAAFSTLHAGLMSGEEHSRQRPVELQEMREWGAEEPRANLTCVGTYQVDHEEVYHFHPKDKKATKWFKA